MEDFDEEDGFEKEEGVLSGEEREGGQYSLDEDAVCAEGKKKRHRDIGQKVKEAHLERGHFVLSESAVQQDQILMQPP